MNERGDTTLFVCSVMLVLTGLVVLCAAELKRNFNLLERRTHLMLCVKETKGELHGFIKIMGQTNWALKNITKIQIISLFIPGLQAIAGNANNVKRAIKVYQKLQLLLYLKKMAELKQKSCPIDPKLLLSPFQLNLLDFKRGLSGVALIRSNEWTYYFLHKPYVLGLTVHAQGFESMRPQIRYTVKESAVTSYFLSSFP